MADLLSALTLVDIVFMVSSFIIVLMALRATRLRANFDLTYIIRGESGNVSQSKTGMAIAMWVSTWVIIHVTLKDQLTEWLFISYMATWAGANLGNKALGRDQVISTSTEKVVTKTSHATPSVTEASIEIKETTK